MYCAIWTMKAIIRGYIPCHTAYGLTSGPLFRSYVENIRVYETRFSPASSPIVEAFA
jgi:hypothetical protein